MAQLRLSSFDRIALAGLTVFMTLFVLPLVLQQIAASGDFGLRILQAYNITQGDISELLLSTPTYSILIFLVHGLVPFFNWIQATLFLSLYFYTVTVVIVYLMLAATMEVRTSRSVLALVVLTLVVVVVQPISVTHLVNIKDMIWEWILLSPHHNQTSIAIRALALPLTLLAIVPFQNHTPFSWKEIIGVMMLVIFATLIKPNWTIAFIPIYAIVVGIACWRGVVWNHKMVLSGFGVSSLIALMLVFGIERIANNSSIVVRFFVYEIRPLLILKLLLSTAFPLYVTLLWHREARQDWALLLAWGVLATSIVQGLIFDETGFHAGYGNFLWGQSIAAWIVFALAVRFYVAQTNRIWRTPLRKRIAWRVGTILLIFHGLSGLLWWSLHYTASATA